MNHGLRTYQWSCRSFEEEEDAQMTLIGGFIPYSRGGHSYTSHRTVCDQGQDASQEVKPLFSASQTVKATFGGRSTVKTNKLQGGDHKLLADSIENYLLYPFSSKSISSLQIVYRRRDVYV